MKDNVFSARRFMNVLRKEIAVNGRMLLLLALGLYMGLTIVMTFGNMIFSHSFEIPVTLLANVVVYCIAAFVFSIMASMAFSGLKTRGSRVDLLMMPATALEKVLVQVLVYGVAGVLVFLLCAQLADLTRIGLMNLLVPSAEIPGPINFLAFPYNYAFGVSNYDARVSFGTMLTMALVASMATYFMGAVLMPRYTWLKMMVVMQVVDIAIFSVLILCGRWMNATWIHYITDVNHGDGIGWFFAVLAIVQAVACAVLAYVFFKRKDVITRSVI
ncbi:MAG: hypothetical protein II786_05320 [Muribaculaceae bacterium]|nr:hypothetical protein [Muribaculaceae bacterium]